MNLCCITCSTGHRGGSSARNFLLCHLRHSCRRKGSCLEHSIEELNLQVLHLCDHRPVCPHLFLRSSVWSRRARAIPCSNAAHRCDVALTAERPFHVERSTFRRGLFVLLVVDLLIRGVLFHALGLLDALSTGLKDAVHLWAQSDIFCE